MVKKVCLTLISLLLGAQIIATNSLSTFAAFENEQVSSVDSIKAEVVGVEGVSEKDITLGNISHDEYDGYIFKNATINNTVVDYVDSYDGNLYYTNKEKNNFGTYLLGNSKVKLNYEKAVNSFAITYEIDNTMASVVGPSEVNNNETLTFRVECAEGYRVTSVMADNRQLKVDGDGYYSYKNVTKDLVVKIKTVKVTTYDISIKNDYAGGRSLTGNATVEVGKTWSGTMFTGFDTLNSIILNNEYINIPNGGKDETKESTLADGTKVSVSVTLKYNYIPAGYNHTYTISVANVTSDLHVIPTVFNGDIADVTLTSIKGLEVYHWNGTSLKFLEMGDIVEKNNSTDVFFVAAKAGYEARIEKLDGAGTKIIERLNSVTDVKNVPGGYEKAKAAANMVGCNYVMYYSDKQETKRTIRIESNLIQYDVQYDLNGAEGLIEDKNAYDILSRNIVTVASIEPSREGFTFVGWKNVSTQDTLQPGKEFRINERLANALTNNTITLQAQWIKNEEMKTTTYAIQYFFQNEYGEYVEDRQYSKMIMDAPVGETAILLDLAPIGNYEFNKNYAGNHLFSLVKNGETESLKAYYVKALKNVVYDKGNAVSGDVPVDANNPYEIGENATILGNTGNLVGNYNDSNDAKFVCWKTDAGVYYYENDTIAVANNVKLTPVFVGDLANEQTTLTFTSGEHGSIIGQSKFAVTRMQPFGKVITSKEQLPVTDATDGYSFDGWYFGEERIATDATSLYDYIKEISQSLQVEARFVVDETAKHDISYTVSYYKGDTIEQAMNATPENITKTVNDVWSGKDSVDAEIITNKYTGYMIDPTNMATLPKTVKDGETIHVYYVKDATKWTTITFIAGNGTINGANSDFIVDNVLIGATFVSQNVTIPEVYANNGWIFTGWDMQLDLDSVIVENMKITAQYKEDKNKDNIPDDEQYVTVNFHAGEYGNYAGKQMITTENMLPGDAIVIPELTVDNAYKFTGYDEEVLNVIPDAFTGRALSYTAQYVDDRNSDGIADDEQYVTVTFDAGAHGNYYGMQVMTTENMLPGDAIVEPLLSVDDAYKFIGYRDAVLSTIPTNFTGKALTYTAQYVDDRNKDDIADDEQYVTVTFVAGTHGSYDGKDVVKTENMLPGDAIVEPELTIDDAYRFTGYDEEVLTVIPNNSTEKQLTYTAQYSQILIPITPLPILPGTPNPDINATPTLPSQALPNQTLPVAIATPLPTPIVPTTPVAPQTPVVQEETPVVEEENITEGNTEVVEEQETPKANLVGEWAILNLLATIATIILAAILILFKNKEGTNNNTDKMIKLGCVGTAFASVIIFFMTQDLSLNMGMSDSWTVLMVMLIAVQVILMVTKKVVTKTK